jgi:hypothetical protein
MHSALIDRAQVLAARLGHLGVHHDLACLTLAELWGVYRYLQRLTNG